VFTDMEKWAEIRRLVFVEGKSKQDVRDYLQHRYGDFVLYDPPLRPTTWLLWFGPLILLLAGGWLVLRISRRGEGRSEDHLLTEQERSRLDQLTGSSTRTHD